MIPFLLSECRKVIPLDPVYELPVFRLPFKVILADCQISAPLTVNDPLECDASILDLSLGYGGEPCSGQRVSPKHLSR